MEADTDGQGNLFIWYRAAAGGDQRGGWLLTSTNQGRSFRADLLEMWVINSCPMSTASIIGDERGISIAWETTQRISYSVGGVSGRSVTMRAPTLSSGDSNNQKHPALAVNDQGQVLMVWAEGTGWRRGGSIAWQVYDAAGQPVGERGTARGLPVWSRPAALARPDGGFVILY